MATDHLQLQNATGGTGRHGLRRGFPPASPDLHQERVQQWKGHPGRDSRWRNRAASLLAASLAVTVLSGCAKPREENIPPARVGPVEAYGVVLDESAPPQQVTYVLLRSLADDVQYARTGRRQEQRAALEITFALAAHSTIEQRLGAALNAATAGGEPTLGEQRDRRIFELVRGWAPIVAYYVRSFDANQWPEFDASVASQMRLRSGADPQAMHVLIDVAHDPDEPNPEAHQVATLDVELRQEKAGDKTYWRVARLSYPRKTTNDQRNPNDE
jgi:hypothetical protein